MKIRNAYPDYYTDCDIRGIGVSQFEIFYVYRDIPYEIRDTATPNTIIPADPNEIRTQTYPVSSNFATPVFSVLICSTFEKRSAKVVSSGTKIGELIRTGIRDAYNTTRATNPTRKIPSRILSLVLPQNDLSLCCNIGA